VPQRSGGKSWQFIAVFVGDTSRVEDVFTNRLQQRSGEGNCAVWIVGSPLLCPFPHFTDRVTAVSRRSMSATSRSAAGMSCSRSSSTPWNSSRIGGTAR